MTSVRPLLVLVLALGTVACGSGASDEPGRATTLAPPQPQRPPSAEAGPSDGGTTDAPAPSYPAMLPPTPRVDSLGGPVLASMKIVPVFFSEDDAAMVAAVGGFLTQLGGSTYWRETTSEYGVGPASALPVVQAPSSDDPPSTIDDQAVQAWLAGKLDGNDPAFPAADADTVYALFYPAGVTVTQQGAASCSAFRGYHEELVLDASHGSAHVPYAVIPRCADATDGGSSTTIDDVTEVASHELVEAATDPLPLSDPAYLQVDDAHFYWTQVLGGSELADMCARVEGIRPADLPHLVQRSWSNAAAQAGHDPCVPTPAGDAYFNSAPALDVVTTSVSGQQVDANGVYIPVGQSATISVRLFSDAPTDAPWNVSARPAAGWASDLTFSFDRASGRNGDVLRMTVTVLHAGKYSREPFVVTSELGGMEHAWIGLVTN